LLPRASGRAGDEGIIDLPIGGTGSSAEERSGELGGAFAPLQTRIEEAERLHIQRALERTGGSISETADLLGTSRKTLWEKMKRLKMKTVEFELSQPGAER